MSTTSWSEVSEWYDQLLEEDPNSFQKKVILPNLERLTACKAGDSVLDLACGQGFFSFALSASGAKFTGIDLGENLIAKANQKRKTFPKKELVSFAVGNAEALPELKNQSFNKIIIILAIQNIEKAHQVFAECARVLQPGGKMWLVMNHPSFRVPQGSDWGFDEAKKQYYRKVDTYMSESKIKIDMTPGSKINKQFTLTFHRPLQYYFKLLGKAGFNITRLEEWISHKSRQQDSKHEAWEKARHEIPMFMCLEAAKGVVEIK
ncbi:MAG: hypothetical protein G01um101418_137 [Parcubacteria group bacterium Gr01-1014_18]|nr:MAG: hypothetical protein Greene041636_441 [Parcubacteria group bacterium Greene0416_36]TSC81464.1 MAG: hypothetical protein G01um101418_137 [Parcubacteria group bacterium Gr01-1014_18]TSC99062.1 MAG: hypothetical protein Greene101420_418 [Parcubacteria group bacterium Greene1014_20]TSD07257.1 MAG: hypothetical protein Greene07142_273 [Parcubacteria group bacterium Greene0714_2]